jgi:hypothetical protein
MMRFSDSAYALSSFHVAETDIPLEEQASELDELSETLQTAYWHLFTFSDSAKAWQGN